MENFNNIGTEMGGMCPEIVWKDRKPYIKTMEELSLIAGDMFVINDINEVWLRGEDKVTIYLSFKFKERSHNIWLHRRGDYLDFRLLYFLNKILKRDYRFELLYTHSEPRVYFINEEEKVSLEDRLKISFYTFEKDPLMIDILLLNGEEEIRRGSFEKGIAYIYDIIDIIPLLTDKDREKYIKLLNNRVLQEILPFINMKRYPHLNLNKIHWFITSL